MYKKKSHSVLDLLVYLDTKTCFLFLISICAVFVQFFHFHPAVLKPDFNLSLSEIEEPRDLVPAVACEVCVKQELFLQFEDLVLTVRAALFAR